MKLILASASPRRRELLTHLGVPFEVAPADLDESLIPGEHASAYVERLVLPTVIEPLREEWDAVRAAALTLANKGDLKKARAEINAYRLPLGLGCFGVAHSFCCSLITEKGVEYICGDLPWSFMPGWLAELGLSIS